MDRQSDSGYPGWVAGQEISSEEEYRRATNWLADKLLAECAPEHLAVIAAQHMIYVDSLKSSNEALLGANEELKRLVEAAGHEVRLEQARRLAVRDAAVSAAITATNALKKHARSKGGKARHEDTENCKGPALLDWTTNKSKYSSRAAFCRQNCKKYSVEAETLSRWIAAYERGQNV